MHPSSTLNLVSSTNVSSTITLSEVGTFLIVATWSYTPNSGSTGLTAVPSINTIGSNLSNITFRNAYAGTASNPSGYTFGSAFNVSTTGSSVLTSATLVYSINCNTTGFGSSNQVGFTAAGCSIMAVDIIVCGVPQSIAVPPSGIAQI